MQQTLFLLEEQQQLLLLQLRVRLQQSSNLQRLARVVEAGEDQGGAPAPVPVLALLLWLLEKEKTSRCGLPSARKLL